ncbi:MAG: galactofuranosyltransferase [Mediterranea sp.]|jgi:hypothetical protein|nr:galactofuranosyltransferase [Mediterranea sp.]
MICYLSRNYKEIESGGGKAKTDFERVMEACGYRNVGRKQTRYRNTVVAFFCTLLSVLKGVCCLRRGDVLVLQYPLKKYYTFVCDMAHLRGCKVVTLIHDLGSFRRKKLTVGQEIARLDHSDALVIHNEAMRQWLTEHGIQAKLRVVEIFDYLSDSLPHPSSRAPGQPYRVLFAGELSPRHNGFLYELANVPRSYQLVLYGKGLERDKLKAPVVAKGFVDPDQLIADPEGDFGLVWYGAGLKGGQGTGGEYLRYNAPHKLSLYLRCQLPAIIWDEAGQAPLVRRYGVGLCVASLEELEEALVRLTPEEYQAMKQNTVDISRKLSEGFFFSEAIRKACADVTPITEERG